MNITQPDRDAAAELAHALGITCEDFTSGAADVLVKHLAAHREAAIEAERSALASHAHVRRAVMASVKLGAWLSAALDDPAVCDAMKADIQEWFSAGETVQIIADAIERGEHDGGSHE